MSRILYINARDKQLDEKSIKYFSEILNKRLSPENIRPKPSKLLLKRQECIIILNPNSNVLINDFSACIGHIINAGTHWNSPNSNIPEGTFSIVRCNHELTEVITDAVGSYTIWYFFSKEVFLASNSQRAIIHYLGSFEFNKNVIPWMLSTGILGPDNSWDRRIKQQAGNSSVILNKKLWKISYKDHGFNVEKIERKHATYYVRKSLANLFNHIELNYNRWILPLSGGADSRLILSLLHNKDELRTITWGTKFTQECKQGDVYIAAKVANYFNVHNQFYSLDQDNLTKEELLDRFLFIGEGRIDTIVAYIDGFKMWKQIFEDNIHGIIRGDHCFFHYSTLFQNNESFRWISFKLLSDYKEFEKLKYYNIPEQFFPQHFNRRKNESLQEWQLRLRMKFRFPYFMNALNDLKIPYVDVFCPMLSKSIIEAILSCASISDKSFIINYCMDIGPDIEFATRASTPGENYIFKDLGYAVFLREYLMSYRNESILDRKLIDYLVKNMCKDKQQRMIGIKESIKEIIKKYIPYSLRIKMSKNFFRFSANLDLFALRAFIIIRMNKLFGDDAGFFKGN